MSGDRAAVQMNLFGADGRVSDERDGARATHAIPQQVEIRVMSPARETTSEEKKSKLREGIKDAGAELVANRRNRILRAHTWADLAPLNDALKVKTAVKNNIWPKPDYDALIAGGMQPLVAHVVKQVYDSVAIKPVPGAGGLIDDQRIQQYIRALNAVEHGVMAWATDRNALRQWAQQNARTAGAMLGQVVSLSDLAVESQTLLDKVFPAGWKTMRAEVIAAGGNKLLGTLQPGYTEIRRAMKALDNGWPAKREAWEVQGYRVVENPAIVIHESTLKYDAERGARFYVTVQQYHWPLKSYPTREAAEEAKAAIGPIALLNKRGVVDTFQTRDEAVETAKNLTTKDRGTTVGELGVKVESVERVGPARRLEGEDISSERLMNEFGFKGVNFGNWMKAPSARLEAQMHLNHAYDSLHDLAEILHLPPRAMSLNGMLGLGIGAQGSGAYAAHFVPGVNEVNLTRTKGAGSLTHEWGHGLDHFFATIAGLATVYEPFLTTHATLNPVKKETVFVDGKWVVQEGQRFSNIRPEILEAFKSIVQAMDIREQTAEEAKTAQDGHLTRAEKSLDRWIVATRRDFGGMEPEFDAIAERIRRGDLGDGYVAAGSTAFLSPAVVALRSLYKQKHGRMYSLENSKGLQNCAEYAKRQRERFAQLEEPERAKVPTNYAVNAQRLDVEKGGKPYWSTRLEKFARAFDAYVSDELDARGMQNGYLAHQGRDGVSVPMGAEREAINKAFRVLVNEIRTRETERGVALFSKSAEAANEHVIDRSEMAKELTTMHKQWPSMPKVTIVDSRNSLPFFAPENCDGAYYRGEVFVVSDKVHSMRQFHKVMAHECVLHHSLETMLGNYGFSKLHEGVQALKAAGDRVVGRIAAEIADLYGVLSPEDETREIVARAGQECLDEKGNIKIGFGFMKSVFAGIANWLRDHGIPVRFTNVELQGLMHDAGQWIRQEHGIEARRPELAYGGTLHSFAGIRAESAPIEKLRVAREMQLAGVEDREIWKHTGWTFAFPDGKPRFELSDSDMTVEPREERLDLATLDSVSQELYGMPFDGLPAGEGRCLDEKRRTVLAQARDAHDKSRSVVANSVKGSPVLACYPEIGTLPVDVRVNDESVESGGYGHNGIRAEARHEKIGGVVAHEMQHAVQEIEGFARGGSPEAFKDRDVTERVLGEIAAGVQKLFSDNATFYRDTVKATQLMDAVKDKYGSLANYDVNDPLVKSWWAAIDERDAHPEADEWFSLKAEENRVQRDRVILSANEQYRRLAGEVEARLVSSRVALTLDERAARYPLDDVDVPVGDQTVEWRGGKHLAPAVEEGRYNGKILDIDDGLATQRVGRSGEIVRHSLCRLSGPVTIGSVVDVTYKDGKGVVSTQERGIER